ncbi:PAS domain S-box protein [Dissulfurimicrobium hydrothermale]|uniref:PAS domain S-box protein n=2 Tax=Dissulfurimicrobium TaxID=1769732 RepID=UPI001EDAAE2D|nr:PAS domain-containing protein [Dissulfurimicrobium hydrothermale]UKL13898.1 PAS domain S-box protein [Dissulfurimicrobium hydrothermale]
MQASRNDRSLLFVADGYPIKPAIAAAVAKTLKNDGLAILVGGRPVAEWTPSESTIMAEAGLGLPERIIPIDGINLHLFDLIICFGNEKCPGYQALPGNPIFIKWAVDEDVETGPPYHDIRILRGMRDRISQLTHDFFEQGYFNALIQVKKNAELVMDNLYDGIIAHDLKRRIFYFNRAAEEITGYNRQDILGKDCHEAFPGKFCDSRCSFCDGKRDVSGLPCHYPLTIRSRQGDVKRAEMSVVPMRFLKKNKTDDFMEDDNKLIDMALEMVRDMIILADRADADCQNDGCRLLFGVIRDCAYRIRMEIERERQARASAESYLCGMAKSDKQKGIKAFKIKDRG